ncbi:ArsR/SmtB family transcription factor [Desulfogranum mediterraneum]|uniref:ArsR/SmtB family transcription factor n=1 Tax=Desulfogranum mediterraneum TaxID=160661 RepID=UPI0003F7E19E|nr:metalloregulator ArsR/SmtB family transcription factor [Desulfogranum mediterraneum]
MADAMEDRCAVRMIHGERVERARQTVISQERAARLAQLFKALGDPNRLRLLLALAEQEMCVCDLAAFLEVSESAVSHQLRLLRTIDLVRNRRSGTVLYYRLADDHVRELIATGLEHIDEPRQGS